MSGRAVARDLPALVRWKLREWEGGPEYDDMLAEGYLEAWKGYLKAEATGARSPTAVALCYARHAPNQWLTKWNGKKELTWKTKSGEQKRSINRRHQYQQVDFGEIRDEPAERFETQVLDRMEASAIWRTVVDCCTPQQRLVLQRVLIEGRSIGSCAGELGCGTKKARQIYREGLERCREALGLCSCW